MLRVQNLTCSHFPTPLGIDNPRPFFSWQLDSPERCQVQSAYRVLVSSSAGLLAQEQGDIWDSGRVTSDQSLQVRCGGRALESRRRCYWMVKAWDGQGIEGPWSEPAWFEMGLLQPEDWQGHWLAHPDSAWNEITPAPFFRKNFLVEKGVQRARVYLCGLGYHEFYLNGRRVGDHVLDPAFTRYDRRVLYVTHDITGLLREGENVFGVVLGNGLFNQSARDAWYFEKSPWRASPRMLFQAHLDLDDGTQLLITSDASWKVTTGPIRFDATRLGEVYDARLDLPGWSAAGYDDSAWLPARFVEAPRGKIASQSLPPVKVMGTLKPVRIWKTPTGETMVDFGQNFAGWVRLRASGPRDAEIVLRHGERIDSDGCLDMRDIAGLVFEGEVQTDRMILSGQGVEEFEPHFTYHGFQYVEVTGYPGELTADQIEGCVVHTSFSPAGHFECSDEVVNRLQRATGWSFISNFVGYPTDCPQREKNGWTGDAHLAAEAGLYNFHVDAAYWKWLDDLADEQRDDGSLPGIVPTSGWGYEWGNGPCWDSACVLIPWYLYQFRGDRAILERCYPMMRRYVDYLIGKSFNGLVRLGLGDWVPPFGDAEDYTAPLALLSTVYFYLDVRVLSLAADLLGQKDEARQYAGWAKRIRERFNQRFYDPVSGLYAGGSQTALSMALYAHLPEPAERMKVARQLLAEVRQQKGRINAGIHGAKAIINALAEHGFHAQAFRLITQPLFPGWAWWLEQGATTLWENWDGSASRNHIMFGDISAWFFRYLAGIRPDPDAPGFKLVIVRPYLAEGMDWVRAEHESPYGRVSSAWRRDGKHFHLEVCLPANTSGLVFLPEVRPGSVLVDDCPLAQCLGIQVTQQRTGGTICRVGSGAWVFDCDLA